MQSIKVKFAIYNKNLGDGSCHPCFFRCTDDAEVYAEIDAKEFDERLCDDISFHELEFDLNGNLLTSYKY